MDIIPFTLVSSDSPDKVFAVGLEIISGDGNETEAITYRRNTENGHSFFGTHTSATAACERYNIIAPLTLRWLQDELEDDLRENALPAHHLDT